MKKKTPLRIKIAGTIVVLVVLLFLVVPHFLPHDPYETSLSLAFLPPGTKGYPLGTDSLGRCILCRILAGGRTTLFSSLCVVLIVFLTGTLLGTVSGFLGGPVDAVIGKITTVFQAFPGFVLAVAIAGILGQGLVNGILSLALVYWTTYARLSRSLVLTLKDAAFVRAARMCGAGTAQIIRKYILPELLPTMVITAAMDVGMVTLSMAGLSFIGLGPARPTAEWGAMMSESRSYFQTAPWTVLFPGIALFCVVLLFNLFGDFFRDYMEKRSQVHEREKEKERKENMKNRKFLKRMSALTLVLALGILTVLSGCGTDAESDDAASAAETESSSDDGGVVITAGTSAGYFSATNLDAAEDWNGWYISFYGVGETLFRLDESYSANPWLVESYENVDELTWTFTLRDDVYFSNGEQMTGDAVAACFERTYEINERAAETLPIESITADGQEITIVTSSANPTITSDLCDPLLTVYYVGEDEDYDTAASYTGPFIVDSFTLNEEITVVKNENYWGGTVNTDKAYLEIFDDSDAMNMALQNGELDIIVAAGSSSLLLFADDDDYQILSASTSRGNFIDFNYESTYGQDAVLREVVARIIDREGYADVICNGASNANYGIYPDTMTFGDNDSLELSITAQDAEGAEALLDEAGYVDTDGDGIREIDGEPISMTVVTISTTDAFVSLSDDMASTLKSIGIELNIQLYEKLESQEDYNGVTWDLCIENKAMSPTGNASYFFDSTVVTGASANYGSYSNTELDALAAELKSAYDTDERNALVFEMEQMLLDDNNFIVFANQNFSCVANTSISDFTVQPSEYYFLDADITKN